MKKVLKNARFLRTQQKQYASARMAVSIKMMFKASRKIFSIPLSLKQVIEGEGVNFFTLKHLVWITFYMGWVCISITSKFFPLPLKPKL